MPDSGEQWTEEDSALYQEIAPVAAPARVEQIAAILTLLPFNRQISFRAVELGCGTGILSYAILDCYPNASVIAFDGSPGMRACATKLLAAFGQRASVESFELEAAAWLSRLESADCVVSSLCLHHLAGQEKERLFADIHRRLSPEGALMIADLVEPQRSEARALFAGTWDRSVETQSLSTTGSSHLYEKFVRAQWNYYRFPDPGDKPSPLFDQLNWLKGAGFEAVDCFWLQAGHAIYGGYKSKRSSSAAGVEFATALEAAERAVSAGSR